MSVRLLKLTICTLLFCLIPAVLAASPMSPELRQRLKAEGRLDEVISSLLKARAKGYFSSEKTYDKAKRDITLGKVATLADVDTFYMPVIIIDFSDNSFMDYTNLYEADDYDSTLFSEGLMATGSMTEFYMENSYGTFYVTGDVVGWFRMPETYAYYVDGQQGWGSCPQCVDQMVIDAIAAADPFLDFSKYDNDLDDYVDGITIIHAGYGAEQTGSPDEIWSHRGWISTQFRDDVYIDSYSIQPHVRLGDNITDIGVFCHEFGHVLGLPDLYDTDGSSEGCGDWTLMAGGSWNGGGHTPAHYDPWCKSVLGYLEPINLLVNTAGVEFPRVEETPIVYRLWKDGVVGAQYFLVENRQQALFDVGLPGEGLVIWHVDETRTNNRNEYRYLVAVEQADGRYDLEGYDIPDGGVNRGDEGDPWPGFTNQREFHDLTLPSSRDYGDLQTEVGVFNISDSDSLMTADLEIVFSRPYIVRDAFDFDDALANDNHRADPGESDVDLLITITNIWADAFNLTMQVSTDYPEIVFADNESSYGTVLHGAQADNTGDPITISVDAEFPPTIVDFILSFTADGGYAVTETLTVDVGPPQVVVVDDDEAIFKEYELYYTRILDSLRTPHTVWGKDTLFSPPSDTLGEYPIVLWFSGDARGDLEVLSSDDVNNLMVFLDNGGRLLMSGQDIAEDLADDADSTLLVDYLHTRFVPGVPQLLAFGVSGDPISNGHTLPLGGPGGAANQNSPDKLEPADAVAKTCYTYYGGGAAGVRVASNGYKAVFLGFGMEAIANGLPGYTKREEVLVSIFDWLLKDEECDCGEPGDVDGTGGAPTPLDVSYLVSKVFKGQDALFDYTATGCPLQNGDMDCSGGAPNPLDVSYLVNKVFKTLDALCADRCAGVQP